MGVIIILKEKKASMGSSFLGRYITLKGAMLKSLTKTAHLLTVGQSWTTEGVNKLLRRGIIKTIGSHSGENSKAIEIEEGRVAKVKFGKGLELEHQEGGEYILRFKAPQAKLDSALTGHLKAASKEMKEASKEARKEVLLALRSLIDKAINVEKEKDKV